MKSQSPGRYQPIDDILTDPTLTAPIKPNPIQAAVTDQIMARSSSVDTSGAAATTAGGDSSTISGIC